MAMRRIVTYDVSSNTARSRLADLCGGFGLRRQNSVFECTIPNEQLADFISRCSDLIDTTHDSVVIVTECLSCRDRRVSLGPKGIDLDAGFWMVGVDSATTPPLLSDASLGTQSDVAAAESGARPGYQRGHGPRSEDHGLQTETADWRAINPAIGSAEPQNQGRV
jgi:CRISPR-associated endonuclease Cas2